MQIDLDIQEREALKAYAKTMAALFRREMGGGRANSLGVDAASVAFWEAIINKLEDEPKPKHVPNVWPPLKIEGTR